MSKDDYGNVGAELAARVFEQLQAEAKADAEKEQVLAKILHNLCIEGNGKNARSLEYGDHDREQQAGDHRRRNRKFAKYMGSAHNGTSRKNDECGKG